VLRQLRSAASSLAVSPRVDVDRERRLIEISPEQPLAHSASCIFMHGLGDTANGFAGTCHAWALEMPHVRFVCPTAPTMSVTLNRGMRMPSWYDIAGLDDRSLEVCDGIEASRDTVLELLEKEAAWVGHRRCVLAGFSQGGAMALFVGLQLSQQLAGIVSLSAYLPKPADVIVTPEALATPVLQCHGEADSMVQISVARKAQAFLEEHGIQHHSFKPYSDLGHAVSNEELEDVADWLASALP